MLQSSTFSHQTPNHIATLVTYPTPGLRRN